MVEVAIKTVNLTKYYGKLLAVDHISFEVKQGEVFGFLGPNGAGKTTTVRMLTGISKPAEGTAEIMGYDILRQAVQAKEFMGIVTDISNVYTDLSAWNNLIFTGRLYDIPRVEREKRAEDLLELFGLYNRRHEMVDGFSKGMKMATYKEKDLIRILGEEYAAYQKRVPKWFPHIRHGIYLENKLG